MRLTATWGRCAMSPPDRMLSSQGDTEDTITVEIPRDLALQVMAGYGGGWIKSGMGTYGPLDELMDLISRAEAEQ